MPVNPLRSLSTVVSCTFISVSAFCMRCTHTPACCTYSARSRQQLRMARISAVGRNDLLNSPYVCNFSNH
jgi:hypothetical protein